MSMFSTPNFSTRPLVPTQLAKHDRWIDTLSVVLGYLWLLSGLNKILGTEFVSGFTDFTSKNLASGGVATIYEPFVRIFILPYATFFAYFIEYGEFLVGVVLIIAGIWNFFKHTRTLGLILVWANVFSFFLILNFILALGLPVPVINVSNPFAEGVSLEYIVLLLSLFMAAANFSEKG